jgi:hypothetical protein
MRRTRLSFLAAVLCLSLLVISPAFAQFRASLQGTVTDQSGAVLGGATVNIVEKGTGIVASTVSTPGGFYRIAGLRPGSYTVTVEAPNFKKNVTADVVIEAEQSRAFDVSLKPGGANESVTVTAQAEGIDTQSANISRGITEQEVRSLPQSGRDPYELLRLTPGIFGDASRGATGGAVFLPNGGGPGGSNSSIFQTENQVQISAFGQRVSANNYQIDGVGVNSLTWGGAAVVTPNQESVQEIMVLPTSYYAEDGRNSGAQVKVISKSGTNSWHGSAAVKYDEPGLNAYNKYGDGFGTQKPNRVENKQRQFAGSIGGPIKKDKLFFFFSYEGLRQSDNSTKAVWLETADYRNLISSSRSGSVTAKIFGMPGVAPRIASVGAQSCAVFNNDVNRCRVVNGGIDIGSPTGATGQYVSLAAPLLGGGFDGRPDLMFAEIQVPKKTTGNQYNGRVDYNLGKHQIFGSTYISRLETLNADDASGARPMDDIRNTPINLSGTLGWIWTLNNSILNEFRFNGTRFAFNQVEASATTNWGVPRIEIEGLPFDRVRFGAPWGETTPGIFAENTFELRDNMSKVWKTHAFKFGIQVTKEQDNNNLNGGSRPLFSFVGPWNLGNSTPIFYQINADPRTGGPGNAQRHFRSTYYGTYLQDEWRLRPNLTLTLGLRYEYFPPIEEASGTLSNLFFGSNGLINSQVRTTSTLNQPDKNNFAPRFGFAWSPSSLDNKFVVRGGYGLAYNRITDSNFTNSRGNPPYFARYNICCGTSAADFSTPFAGGQILYALGASNSPFSYPVNPALAQGIDPVSGGAAGGSVEIYGSRQNMPIPYVQNFSLDLQYELPANMTLETGYHGSIGRKLIRLVNQNFLQAPNPKFFAVYFPTPDTNSEYNALVTHLRRRFNKGLLFDFTHTWSRSIDYISNEGPGFTSNQTDPAHLKTERGPSDYDHTHEITLSGLYELPFGKNRSGWMRSVLGGWQVSPIFTWHTGFPWTPMTCRLQSVPITGANTICPTRPSSVLQQATYNGSNDAFTRTGGNFPGGGLAYFGVTPGPPGIGRNSYRGPRYSSIDMAIGKDTKLPFLGEQGNLNVRMNIFNVFNQLNIAPFQFGSGSVTIDDPHFGMAQQGLAGRVVELQARFSF